MLILMTFFVNANGKQIIFVIFKTFLLLYIKSFAFFSLLFIIMMDCFDNIRLSKVDCNVDEDESLNAYLALSIDLNCHENIINTHTDDAIDLIIKNNIVSNVKYFLYLTERLELTNSILFKCLIYDVKKRCFIICSIIFHNEYYSKVFLNGGVESINITGFDHLYLFELVELSLNFIKESFPWNNSLKDILASTRYFNSTNGVLIAARLFMVLRYAFKIREEVEVVSDYEAL